MKYTVFIILVLVLIAPVSSQDFENGEIGIALSNACRIRVTAPTLLTQQIDRSSLLFGLDSTTVFNYNSDADVADSSRTISDPVYSDHELYAACDNSYSGAPPDILEKVNIYGWNTGGYVIARIRIFNQEANPMTAKTGIEILPRVEGSYGLETVEYIADENIVSIHRAHASYHTGYKIFSGELGGLKSIEWYSGYDSSDVQLYEWLTYPDIDTVYNSGGDGAVAFLSKLNTLSVLPGDSVEFYLGISVGPDELTMINNMDSAFTKYNNIFVTSLKTQNDALPAKMHLLQNYPNPFNPDTKITFTIPQKSFVTLKVFNILGKEVAKIVSGTLNSGTHSYNFNASNLPSGVYYYTLTSENNFHTKKMVLIK